MVVLFQGSFRTQGTCFCSVVDSLQHFVLFVVALRPVTPVRVRLSVAGESVDLRVVDARFLTAVVVRFLSSDAAVGLVKVDDACKFRGLTGLPFGTEEGVVDAGETFADRVRGVDVEDDDDGEEEDDSVAEGESRFLEASLLNNWLILLSGLAMSRALYD